MLDNCDRCGNGKEWRQNRDLLVEALCREHVMCEVVLVVLPPMVRSEECLNVTPGSLDSVSVVSGVRIDERNAETFRLNIRIRSPAITDERSAGFNPSTDNVRQSVEGSVRYGNKKCFTGPAFDSRQTPTGP